MQGPSGGALKIPERKDRSELRVEEAVMGRRRGPVRGSHGGRRSKKLFLAEPAATGRIDATGPPTGIGDPVPTSIRPTRIGTQHRDQASLSRRQPLREHLEVMAARLGHAEDCIHVDPDHMPAWRQPQLALAGQ